MEGLRLPLFAGARPCQLERLQCSKSRWEVTGQHWALWLVLLYTGAMAGME